MKNIFTHFKSILALSVILMHPFISESQESERANYWHFGNQAAINFACTPESISGSELNSGEGSASISDLNGNLLFYTSGQTVWDRNNNIMPNGTGLLGNISTVQSAVIIPHPGNTDRYFIFTAGTSIEDNGTIGVRFSEVDMSLNGGNGDVLLGNKNTLLFIPNEEKLTAVENAAGNGYWVTAQEKSSNIWNTYEVTAAGVNTTPVVSITGPEARPNNSLGAKFSPDGTLLVSQAGCSGGNPVQPNWNPNLAFYSFDDATGQITYLWGDCGAAGFDLAFSPDCSKLYARGVQMFQYDLSAGVGIIDSVAIIASKVQLTTTNWSVNALQLANNCKIYVAEGGTAIGEIQNPNAAGFACNYVPGAFTLTSGTTGGRFPNFVQSFFNAPCTNIDIEISGNDASCVSDGEASVNVLQGIPPYSFLWSTGETSSSISNLSEGWYSVVVSDNSGCTLTDSIFINQPQTISIDGATITNASACGASDGAIDLDLSVIGSSPLTSLLAEGFETDGHLTRYTANPYPGTPSGTVFFKRGDDASINFSNNPTDEEGVAYFGARRTGFSGLPANCDVTTDPTNIVGFTNIEVCVLLALGRNNMNTDNQNHLTIEYNIDGLGWNTLAAFRPPAGPFSTGLSEDTDNDGEGDGVALSTAFQDFCYQIPTTGSNIQVRVSTDMSGSSLRQSAFDNIRVNGQAPYSFTVLWSNSETTEDIAGLAAGTYDVTITGQNGCIVQESFTIADPCSITASYNTTATTICEGDDITFTDNSSGAITSWDWTFDGGTPNNSSTQGPHTIAFNTPGTYTISLEVSDGAATDDTTITVTVNPISTFTQSPIICQGGSITVGSNTYSTTGNYSDILINSFGCDSIVTTNLTVSPAISGTDVQTSCESYAWIDGMTYTSSTNTPTFTIVGGAANGCDSLVTLDLTITNQATSLDVHTVCGDFTWIDGVTYTSSTNTPTFTIVGGAANGCDSIVTLDLTITNQATSVDVHTVCGDFTWIDGVTYSTSTNTPTFTINGGAANGCDSIVTLDLTINNAQTGIDVQSTCGDFTWIDGVTYTSSTAAPTFTIIGGASNGCDSIVTLDLTVTAPSTTINTYNECEGFSVTVGANTYNSTGIFTDIINSCDTIITDLTIIPLPSLSLIQTDENCSEENGSVSAVVNTSNPPISYSWSTGSSSSTIDDLVSGTYTVIVSDASGCSVTDSVTLLNTDIDCDYFVYLPNGFTPNGDQNNDILFVRGKGISTFTLNVYNRWGNKVFETNDLDTGWDGAYKDEPQNSAVFVYTIEGVFLNGNTFKESGDITLIR